MQNPPVVNFQPDYPRPIKIDWRAMRQSLAIKAIALAIGLTFILSGCFASSKNTPSPSTPIPVSNEEVKNYARTVIAIEPSRIATYKEIQSLSKSQKPLKVNCSQPDTIKALPTQAQEIAVNYCNQAKKIGESNGLTIARFNEITLNAQSDPELKRRIQNELIRLQG